MKLGDKFNIKVNTRNILGSGATLGEVHIYDADVASQADPDSAFFSATYPSRDLLFGVSESYRVAAGASGNQKKAFGNRQRVKLAAFLVDRAGNRSAATADAADPAPYYQELDNEAQLVYIFDSEKPTVTMTRPKGGTTDPDSLRFTADSTATVDLVGVTDDPTYPLMPMDFAVSEPLGSLEVVLGDSTVTIGDADRVLFEDGEQLEI